VKFSVIYCSKLQFVIELEEYKNIDMYSINLVLIVKNESRCIDRCLSSFREFVDEIILVDTGSTDDTLNKSLQYDPIIYQITWADDFSLARNYALEKSQADWNIVVDADEWLMSGASHIHTLKNCSANFVGLINIVNQFEGNQQLNFSISSLPRVLPKGVRYEGKVHEQPVHVYPIRNLEIQFGHDGYQASQRANKIGRNEKILRSELVNFPNDSYTNYQLGKQLTSDKNFEAAIVFFETAKNVNLTLPWRHDLVVRLLFCYKNQKRFIEGFLLIENEEKNYWNSPDFYFVCGDFLIDAALYLPEYSSKLIPLIEINFLKAREIGENSNFDDRVIGRGSFLAAYNLYAYYLSIGKDEAAKIYLNIYEEEIKSIGHGHNSFLKID